MTTKLTFERRFGGVAMTLFICATAGLADRALSQAAAPANDAGSELSEIVVTANLVSQNLQQAPISITAVNAQMLEARGESNLLDVSQNAPNVTIQEGAANFGPAPAIFIRGIGQYDSNFALEPGVGVYIDDVYQPTLIGSQIDLLDLDRVEILRGPQGTNSGQNSAGGAIKLFTTKPNGGGDGFVEAGYGTFDHIVVRGAVDLSIIPEKLFVRISGASDSENGYLTRYDYACTHPGSAVASGANTSNCVLGHEGGTNHDGIRSEFRYLATDKLEINFSLEDSRANDQPPATRLVDTNNPALAQYVTPSKYVNYSTYAVPAADFFAGALNDVQSFGAAGTVDYKIADQTRLKFITAYRSYDSQYTTDEGATESPLVQYYTLTFREYTEELRFQGTLFNRLDYTLGGFYYNGYGVQGGRINQAGEIDFVQSDEVGSTDAAGYVQAAYHLTDQLTATAGFRYTDQTKNYLFQRTAPGGGPLVPTALDPINGLLGGLNGVDAEYKRNHRDYRAILDYQMTPQNGLYASYSTGFKGGGVNPRPFTVGQAVPFGPETIDAYEIGSKNELFDRRLRLNASVFFNDYKAIQETITGGYAGFPASAVPINSGTAHVYGAELEAEAHPTSAMMIDGSVSFLHFEFVQLSAAAQTSDVEYGDVAPFSPSWHASVGIQYAIPAGSVGTLTPRLTGNYQSSFFTDPTNTRLGQVSGYVVSNGRLTWSSASPWQVSLYVNNLFDRYYYVNNFNNLANNGTVVADPARPREVGIQVKRSF